MRKLTRFSVIVLLFSLWVVLSSCSSPSTPLSLVVTPSPESAKTSSPTSTISPSYTPTLTLTSTFTPSPTATQIGGEEGYLMYFDDLNLFKIGLDGSNNTLITPAEDFVNALELQPGYKLRSATFSPTGDMYRIVICYGDDCEKMELLIGSLDFQRVLKYDLSQKSPSILDWSDNETQILIGWRYKGSDGYFHADDLIEIELIDITPEKFGTVTNLGNARTAFFSVEQDELILYKDDFYSVDLQTGGTRIISCDNCPSASADEPLSLVYPMCGYKSPSKDKYLIGYSNDAVIFANSDFSSITHYDGDSSFNCGALIWSPDEEYYLFLSRVETMLDDRSRRISGTVGIMDVENRISSTLTPGGDVSLFPCGWSPDSKLIIYREVSPTSTSLNIHDYEINYTRQLIEFTSGTGSCPIWISESDR